MKTWAASREAIATEVIWEDAKSVITRNQSPDIDFDHSINPYRGCEHGCIYCFARPTHSYLGLSPGLDFETKIIAKRNIAEVLRADLARPGYVPRSLAVGTATDCYQPIERDLGPDPFGDRGAAGGAASAVPDYQVERGRARPRPAGADGSTAPGGGST